jgi:beta-glucosidase
MFFMKYFLTLLCVLSSLFLFADSNWDWDKIDQSDLFFPKEFLFGTATAEYQNSGAETCKMSNFALWELEVDEKGNPRIVNGDQSGLSCDHYHRYKEDIALMKNIGCNSYRFSIEWSLIEPEEGKFSKEGIDHYIDVCNELIKAGITPMVTLHHFSHPIWFEEKGGWMKEENIAYFVRYAKFVFEHLQDKVSLWATINEPSVVGFMSYLYGKFPPGERTIPKLPAP